MTTLSAALDNPTLAEHAAAIRARGKRVVADVIEIGARLTECKRICGHGNWLPWLDREFGWEETTAQRFMRVHELASSKSGNLPDLPVSAIYLLAAPSRPDEARDEIIARAKAGEKINVEALKETVAKARKSPENKTRHRESAANDIGPSSAGELARLRARIADLESENRRLEHDNAALRHRVAELENAAAKSSPPADDDGLGIPTFLRRVAP
jgi:hypothetical protein